MQKLTQGSLPILKKDNLHGYQCKAVQHIIDNPSSALFLDMGLGKTASTLTAIDDLINDHFVVSKVLVIAPLRVAETVWHTEAKKWEHTSSLKFSLVTGNLQKRLIALQRKADVYVTNRENVVWLVEHFKSKFPFDMVVIDESSSFKNNASKRMKAMKKILPFIDRMVLLTGTPSPNGYMDLYSQFYLLDQGERLGKNITMFRSQYFSSSYSGFGYDIRPDAIPKIQDKIKDLVLSMKSEDYLELPSFIPTVLGNTLSGNLLKKYLTFEKDMLLNVGTELVTAMSAATLSNKLLQFCSGNIYGDDKKVHHFHDLKIDTLEEIVDENPDENILVAYNYKHELEALSKAFPKAVKLGKDGQAVMDWNEGKIKMLLAHPACLTADTEVLTEHRGWVKIIDVKITDKVFDGIEYVSHSGCTFSGVRPTINVFGINMTLNHKLLIDNKWVKAKNVKVDDKERARFKKSHERRGSMCPMQTRVQNDIPEFCKTQPQGFRPLQRVYKRYSPQHDELSNMENMERCKGTYTKPIRQKLWWSRYLDGRAMVGLQNILFRYGGNLCGWLFNRTIRRERALQQEKLHVVTTNPSAEKQKDNTLCNIPRRENTLSRVCTENWDESMCNNHEVKQGLKCRGYRTRHSQLQVRNTNKEVATLVKRPVYDLVDCGERTRFLIRNSNGEEFISHNSAGHGLNLQYGGNIMVWYGFTWSLELYQQFNKRLHRQGQTKPVRCFHIAVGEVEERLMKTLALKDVTQATLLEMLK